MLNVPISFLPFKFSQTIKYFYHLSGIILFVAACKANPDSNRNYADETKVYKLHLDPGQGSKYHFEINNETEFRIEVNDKKTTNRNETTVGVNYEINKDSTGNLILHTRYDKIHLYSKSEDTETELDADNARFSVNPMEKMLAPLKAADIVATVSPTGEVKSSSGLKEIASKMLEQFPETDEAARTIIERQWNKLIEEKIVKNNMDELFKIFPDSAVHVGDEWKMTSNQNNDINLIVKAIYRLKAINNDVAIMMTILFIHRINMQDWREDFFNQRIELNPTFGCDRFAILAPFFSNTLFHLAASP